VPVLRFRIYSDYLCPWCANAAHRWQQLEREYGDQIELEWRSYLLRPRPRAGLDDPQQRARALARFRGYSQGWKRPADEADAFPFQQPWRSDEGPPSHSVPAHLVAKAAARVGPDAFRAMHRALLDAYFTQHRDISDGDTLFALWRACGLPEGDFERRDDSELMREVLSQHSEAIEVGATGVPAAQLVGNDAVIIGAQPVELYRRWIDRTFERLAEGRGPTPA
jgi:predicted DsbA family dithiol-disulfide isomerase